MSVLLMTVFGGVGLNTDKSQGRLDRFRALPMWQPAVVVGGLLAEIVRFVICAALVLSLGTLIGFRADGGWAGILASTAVLTVFALSLSWVWAALGLRVATPQTVSVLSFAAFFPLTFASNAFVDPATMPGVLRTLVEANPISHLVTTERELMAGTAEASDILSILGVAVIIVAIFAPLTMRAYRRAA
jgi:ABC-2 type transport system permease protein